MEFGLLFVSGMVLCAIYVGVTTHSSGTTSGSCSSASLLTVVFLEFHGHLPGLPALLRFVRNAGKLLLA